MWGQHYVRFTTMALIGLGVTWLYVFSPSALQSAANVAIFWTTDPNFKLFELISIIIGVGWTAAWLATSDIRGDVTDELEA